MLAIRVELLTGGYSATTFNNRGHAEWPPHPARLFFALVAAYADSDRPDPAERAVLQTLERLGPPQIGCTDPDTVGRRSVVTHYVPGNDAGVTRDQAGRYAKLLEAELAADRGQDDRARRRAEQQLGRERTAAARWSASATAAKSGETGSTVAAGTALLPELRNRQPRAYPVVVPAEPAFWFLWPGANLAVAGVRALDGLLARVGRLGHSSSFVSCAVVDEAPPANLVPSGDGQLTLRVPAPGLLELLEEEYLRHRGREPRALPAGFARYGTARPAAGCPPTPVFAGEWIALRFQAPRRLPIRRSLDVARAVRGALMAAATQPPAEILSGHVPGPPGDPTPPSTRPHLVIAPLTHVGHSRADGTLQGVALLLPVGVSRDDRVAVLSALGGWLSSGGQLRLGRAGSFALRELADEDVPVTLRRISWSRPSATWTSVTPVALDRAPGDLWSARPERREAALSVAHDVVVRACTFVGLPQPADVVVHGAAPLSGVPPLRAFPPFRNGRGHQRVSAHVRVTFGEPVAGPLLLGAGRYLGQGLFWPVRD